jgi:hypothetical protein
LTHRKLGCRVTQKLSNLPSVNGKKEKEGRKEGRKEEGRKEGRREGRRHEGQEVRKRGTQ